MEIFIKIVQFIFSLSLIVIVHEFGHFLFARLFGARVEKFYLFFNPWFSLFKVKIGQTEYGIGWIPLGGYVKIAGMIDESLDTEQMSQPPKPDEFRSKPAWQRLLIMSGGILMNMLLAVCIYIGMSYAYGDRYIANEDLRYGYVFNDLAREIGFRDGDRILSVGGQTPTGDFLRAYVEIILGGATDVEVLRDGQRLTVHIDDKYVPRILESTDFLEPRVPFVIGQTMEGSPAAEAGFQAGDSLVALNGAPLVFFDQFRNALAGVKGKTVELTVARDSAGYTVERTLPVTVSQDGTIGVYAMPIEAFFQTRTVHYTFLQSIPAGIKRTGSQLADYWKQLKMIFSPKTKAYKSLGGFLAIGSLFPDYWSWYILWARTAFLAVVFSVMNLLPIPGLDGGHILFVLYELITGRKPSDKFLERAQVTGLLFLLALLLYANLNDVYRFFIKT